MTLAFVFAILAYTAVLVAVLLTHDREDRRWAGERQKLLDRIQFPEVRQVEAYEPIIHEPPKDSAEMAYVGEIVPEFVNVGTPDGD